MKKLLPLMIAGLTAGAYTGVATAENTVYGKMNVSLNNYDKETDGPGNTVVTDKDNWELESNASRVGIKGSYALGSGSLKAIYKAEYQISVDGDDDEFSQRNIYAGLQGSAGTLIAGKHDTPTKLAQGKVDRFNDLPLGDIKNYVPGETRASNIVMYTSPKLNGLSVTAAFIPGEQDGTTAATDRDGLADGTSIAINWKMKDLRIALSSDSEVSNGSSDLEEFKKGDLIDATRLVAEYQFGNVKLGALIQETEYAGSTSTRDDEADSYVVSAEIGLNEKTNVKLQYGETTEENATNTETDYNQIAIGLDYKLNKSAKVFAYYSTIETEYDSGPDEEDTTFAIGYEVKF